MLLSKRDYFLFQVHFGVAWRTETHWYSVEYMLNHASQLYCMDSAKRGIAVYLSEIASLLLLPASGEEYQYCGVSIFWTDL